VGLCTGNPTQKALLHKGDQNCKHYYSLTKTVLSTILIFLTECGITPAQGPGLGQF